MFISDEMMKQEVAEFEIGKRHLARIMGLDEDNITQQDIDVIVTNLKLLNYRICYIIAIYLIEVIHIRGIQVHN